MKLFGILLHLLLLLSEKNAFKIMSEGLNMYKMQLSFFRLQGDLLRLQIMVKIECYWAGWLAQKY